jgi:transcription elongation factor Elf1
VQDVKRSELKAPTRIPKCPYCGSTGLSRDIDVECDNDRTDTVFDCQRCGTRFALFLETLPENQSPEQKAERRRLQYGKPVNCS